MRTIESLGCGLYAGAAYPRVNTVVRHLWVVDRLEMVKVADIVKGFLSCSMSDWKTVLISNREVLDEEGIKGGLFQ